MEMHSEEYPIREQQLLNVVVDVLNWMGWEAKQNENNIIAAAVDNRRHNAFLVRSETYAERNKLILTCEPADSDLATLLMDEIHAAIMKNEISNATKQKEGRNQDETV